MLDYVERLCGIMPRPENELWFTGLLPYAVDHGEGIANGTAYSRIVDGVTFELVNTLEESMVYRNGIVALQFPNGLRVVTDRQGKLKSIICMSVRIVEGVVSYDGCEWPVSVRGNEQIEIVDGQLVKQATNLGIIAPTYR